MLLYMLRARLISQTSYSQEHRCYPVDDVLLIVVIVMVMVMVEVHTSLASLSLVSAVKMPTILLLSSTSLASTKNVR